MSGNFTQIGGEVVNKRIVRELVSGIDDVIPLFRGVYNDDTEYDLNDIVTVNGAGYWHIGTTPTTGTAVTDTEVWSKFTNAFDIYVTGNLLNIVQN